jgi:phosphate transport system protein
MTTHHDHDLALVKDMLLAMASHAQTAITQAVSALVERNDELAQKVKIGDSVLDELEMDVDDTATVLLSRAPLASELRFIIVAMKISHNLERVGDEATGIAKLAIKLNREPVGTPEVDIPRLAEMALEMLRLVMDAFITKNADKAREVVPKDSDVDSLHKQIQRVLISYMLEAPPNITRCLALMQIAKRLERIADHATNIAEEVVYMVEGRDIRHGHR